MNKSFTPATLLEIYRKARLINLIDERFRGLLRSGRLAAVYYSPRGQEILAAAMGVHLQQTDYLVTTNSPKAFRSSRCSLSTTPKPRAHAKARAVRCTSRIRKRA